jgi:hypothetical protein
MERQASWRNHHRDSGYSAKVGDAICVIPTVNAEAITPSRGSVPGRGLAPPDKPSRSRHGKRSGKEFADLGGAEELKSPPDTAATRPAHEAVIDRRQRAILGRAIAGFGGAVIGVSPPTKRRELRCEAVRQFHAILQLTRSHRNA